MIRHAWSLACNKSIIDPTTNNTTIVDVVEQINIPPGSPVPTFVPMQIDFVSVWYRSDAGAGERGTGRLTIACPDGDRTQQIQFAVDLSLFYRTRTIVRSSGLSLRGPGIYNFVVELSQDGENTWTPTAEVPLTVAEIAQTTATQGTVMTM